MALEHVSGVVADAKACLDQWGQPGFDLVVEVADLGRPVVDSRVGADLGLVGRCRRFLSFAASSSALFISIPRQIVQAIVVTLEVSTYCSRSCCATAETKLPVNPV